MSYIDNFLNRITMYRLLLYGLIILLVAAFILALFHVLPFSPWAVLVSSLYVVAVSWVVNWVFAKVWRGVPNSESASITALILALIITPGLSKDSFMLFTWAGVLSMASKYILAIHKRHIFNPASFAVAITAAALSQSASWWVGTAALAPLVFILGVLIVRKIHQADLVISFFIVAVLAISVAGFMRGSSPVILLPKIILDTPILFFAFIMLTEPVTTPPTRRLQIVYGALVGILFTPQLHFGPVYSTPELALGMGSIFSYAVSPKFRYVLRLEAKQAIGQDIVDFVFRADRPVRFTPGQYMEWTLGVPHPDDRGNRRYFTLASSPTEDTVRLGVKFYPKPSRFKQIMTSLNPGDTISASQLAGNFVMSSKADQKYVFIAGGIGVTPFRSQIKYLLDTKQKRDIVLLYSNKFASEIAYADIFMKAQKVFGLKTVYTLSETDQIPAGWTGQTGMITQDMIASQVPDYKERLFYLSGPHGMVTAFEGLLKQMGVPKRAIKIDYFPGFA